MQPLWINLGQQSRHDGAFITLRGNRSPSGYIRLQIYFSAAAVHRMALKAGERVLIGLDGEGQQLVMRETIYGGTGLTQRSGRRELAIAPTLPTFSMPEPQAITELQLKQIGRDWAFPFRFDASQLLIEDTRSHLRAAA